MMEKINITSIKMCVRVCVRVCVCVCVCVCVTIFHKRAFIQISVLATSTDNIFFQGQGFGQPA